MGILNRTMEPSEKLEVLSSTFNGPTGVIAVGATLMGCFVPSAGTLRGVAVTCQGASIVPTSSVQIVRFIPGAGATTLSGIGASFLIPAIGVSGFLSVSLVAAGSAVLNLLAGDCIQVILGVNSASGVQLSATYAKTQDIVSRFGITS